MTDRSYVHMFTTTNTITNVQEYHPPVSRVDPGVTDSRNVSIYSYVVRLRGPDTKSRLSILESGPVKVLERQVEISS